MEKLQTFNFSTKSQTHPKLAEIRLQQTQLYPQRTITQTPQNYLEGHQTFGPANLVKLSNRRLTRKRSRSSSMTSVMLSRRAKCTLTTDRGKRNNLLRSLSRTRLYAFIPRALAVRA